MKHCLIFAIHQPFYLYTEICIEKKRYRANPAYRGKPWYDWAIVRVELSEEEKKTIKIQQET